MIGFTVFFIFIFLVLTLKVLCSRKLFGLRKTRTTGHLICAGPYARHIYSYLRKISVNKIWTQRQRRMLHGECKSICSRENELKSGEYREMLGQVKIMKADPRTPDEEWNSGVNDQIWISCSLNDGILGGSSILQNTLKHINPFCVTDFKNVAKPNHHRIFEMM